MYRLKIENKFDETQYMSIDYKDREELTKDLTVLLKPSLFGCAEFTLTIEIH